jgi:hypothetical protein
VAQQIGALGYKHGHLKAGLNLIELSLSKSQTQEFNCQ